MKQGGSLLREKWVGIDGVQYPLPFNFKFVFLFLSSNFDIIMASQAAAILRVIERKRRDKLRANLAKIQQTHPDTPQQIYSDRLTQQVWNKHYFF